MTPEDNLRQKKAALDSLLDTLMSCLNDNEITEQAIAARLTNIPDGIVAYQQALRQAAEHAPQEVAEDRRRAAQNLPAQVAFFADTIIAYRKRYNL